MDDLRQIAIHDLSRIVPRSCSIEARTQYLNHLDSARLEWIHRNKLKIYSIENSSVSVHTHKHICSLRNTLY